MRFLVRQVLVCMIVAGVAAPAVAQAASKPAAKSPAVKSYCHPRYSFCFKYPAGWTMLGEVYDGHGVVVAPSQQQDREQWDEVTVALVIPPPDEDEDPVSIDEAIAQAVSGVRKSGQSFETLERQQRTVDGKPAEAVKLHYVEQANGHEWIEELVLIEGPQSEIYSVALKSSPATLTTMEPAFQRMVESWKLPEPTPPPEETPSSKPKSVPSKPPAGKPPTPKS